MIQSVGYAANHSFTGLKRHEFEREDPRPNEVLIDILYCGVCHSDIHQVKNDWGNTVYPCMPGHEIVGRVAQVGSDVSKHQVGDVVGVGCMIDSCRTCEPCRTGDENYCEGPNSWLATYNGPMVPSKKSPDGENHYGRDNTFGGYSINIVVPEDFVLKVPANLPVEKVAPILCAGVTTYSPMKHWGLKAGQKVGIVGFGGLGDMAAKLAKAMGAEVVLFTETEEKLSEAARLGVQAVYSKDKDQMESQANTCDFILSTIPEPTDLEPFIPVLKRDASLVIVGALDKLKPFNNMEMAMHRKSVGGSLIGSIRETQEVLDFCAEHGITPDVEMIGMDDINDAHKRVNDREVRFRYVIDMASLKTEEA
ncbi:NAD(P)-dependent alcohol dehydrogenase [Terriglobus aquaticus]|uniref:NAD(P)-dependent alcohol dehydrogenase n=1 Tax=Terriglobus aquaticus TaxID=940139 RepID=A0ABW9KRZ8_9BACT|nr:NAD(P)-dependent alcohol dehydrogenase [Terriglobus aquaticus]